MATDLSNMSREELLKLKGDVEKALDSLEIRRKAEALRAAEDAARQYGFSLTELNAPSPDGKKTKGVPKYANPADPSQTWTGRGRKPKWVLDHLAADKPLEDLEI